MKDAALLSGKSAQTIRRLIKGSKIRYRKYKTPQGFTYLVEKTSLLDHFKMNEVEESELNEAELVEEFDPSMTDIEIDAAPVVEPVMTQPHPQPVQTPPVQTYEQARPEPATRPFAGQNSRLNENHSSNETDLSGFQNIMGQMVQQHRDDKKRLFELLETFQKRILTLEDQLKQLSPPPENKRWYQIFKK